MDYKFHRGCWVESQCGYLSQTGSGFFDIVGRIDRATRVFEAWGPTLAGCRSIRELLDQLRRDLQASREAMIELGVVRACARCDESAHAGSCCSNGLENKFDVVLLLINLLLGFELPREREREGSCFFLGAPPLAGCKLGLRHMLCIDYFCPELEKALGRSGLMELQKISGNEIETGFRLGEEIKRLISKGRQAN